MAASYGFSKRQKERQRQEKQREKALKRKLNRSQRAQNATDNAALGDAIGVPLESPPSVANAPQTQPTDPVPPSASLNGTSADDPKHAR
jgi:hypothetical protein